jgi:CRP-like cAMP-binding protein
VFQNLVRAGGCVAWDFVRLQAQEAASQTLQLADRLVPARRRLERLLYELAMDRESQSSDEPIRIQLLLKHRHVAELISVTPQYLSHLFRQLEADGWIRWAGRDLILSSTGHLWHGG